MSRRSDPAALGPNRRVTPRSFIAQTLARYGTRCGGNSWSLPCRGRNATRRSPIVPIVIGALGGPYGVSIVTSSGSSRKA